jgi:hypothetical protein
MARPFGFRPDADLHVVSAADAVGSVGRIPGPLGGAHNGTACSRMPLHRIVMSGAGQRGVADEFL